jgi:hypothetical protein
MSAERHIRKYAEGHGGGAATAGRSLTLSMAAGHKFNVQIPEDWNLKDLAALRHALPGRARGDQRERLIAAIAEDAFPEKGGMKDDRLREALAEPGRLPVGGEPQRQVLASVMQEHYWVRPEATGSGALRQFAFPFHAAIPANFPLRGQYKMFRSDIFLFLCWDGHDIDPEPVEAICELLSDRDEFTLLDDLLVNVGLDLADGIAHSDVTAAALLRSKQAEKVRSYLKGGAFHQASHDRFRADFMAAVSMPLPRHDRVEAAILTLSLHLGLYYYELSYILGTGLDAITRAAAGIPAEQVRSFAGLMRFRVGTAGDRPVRRADGCASAWRELDDHYLISLIPNIICANLLHQCWSAAGGKATAGTDPEALSIAMAADREFAKRIDMAAGALAISYAAEEASASALQLARLSSSREPGVHLLRSVIHSHLRGGLHYRSRAVVNQLVKRRYGGTLIRRRGSVIFFELDEDFLFLLVKFTLTRRRQRELPFRDFLDELSAYGLAPQDREEEERFSEALERLGMLHRYSDAGEAMYVRHPL